MTLTSFLTWIYDSETLFWWFADTQKSNSVKKSQKSHSVLSRTDELNIFHIVFKLCLHLVVLPSTEYLLKTGLVLGHFTLLKQYCATEFDGPAYNSLHSPLLQSWGWRIAVTPVLTHTHKEKCMLKPIRQVEKRQIHQHLVKRNTVAIEITSKSERKGGIIPKTHYKAHLI